MLDDPDQPLSLAETGAMDGDEVDSRAAWSRSATAASSSGFTYSRGTLRARLASWESSSDIRLRLVVLPSLALAGEWTYSG